MDVTPSFPLSLAPGDVVPGTPLLRNILDFDNKTINDVTFSFWISSKKTVTGNEIHNQILHLGTANSFLCVRFNRIHCQTRNTNWGPGTPISLGYSQFDETWVHIGITIEQGLWTSYLDGFPTGHAQLEKAFQDTKTGKDIGFVSVPAQNKQDKPNKCQIEQFRFEKRVWSSKEMRAHVLATAPEGAKLHVTRAYEQGFQPISDRKVFRQEYLFGSMPPPYSLPRLLFSQDDIPDLRAMYSANDRMRTHRVNAECMVTNFLQNRMGWLQAIPDEKDSTDIDAQEIVDLLFASILVDNATAHQLLADASMRIIRHKKQRIVLAAEKSSAWEQAGLPVLYHKDCLAIMLDLSGPRLSLTDIKEALAILSIGAKGRRPIYSKHITSDPFEMYTENRKYATMRRGSNRDVWEGSTLATVQLLLHGHDDLYDPKDIYATYNTFHEQVRKTMSAKGVSNESAGKTALWRGFLPWIMLARHRIPGIDNPIWNSIRLQRFAASKQMQLMPSTPIIADHGTWGRALPRQTWSAFFTLLNGSAEENKDNAWLARLVDPRRPLKERHVRRLLQEQGTGLIESETAKKTALLFCDEKFPVKPVYNFDGAIVGFRNSDRSCVFSEQSLDVHFRDNWHFALKIRTKADGCEDGQLASLFEDKDDPKTALHLYISEGGTKVELQAGKRQAKRAYLTIDPEKWQEILLRKQGSKVLINNGDAVAFECTNKINLILGSFSSLKKRLGANCKVSRTAVRDIRLVSDDVEYRWNEFPRSAFGRTLRKPISMLSLLDHRHWSDEIEYSDCPSERHHENLFDEATGYFAFSCSTSPLSSAVIVYSMDTSGGHVFKCGGHFDIFGVGTGWLCVESRMNVFADNYNSILVDNKPAPGVVETEQGVYVQGDVCSMGAWVEIDLTWYYRHSKLVHFVNGVGFDESADLLPGGIMVKKASRIVSHVKIGPPARSVTVVSDYISMCDGEPHTFTWLGQIMERHGVSFDTKPSEGLLDIWLEGDADLDFTGEERKDAPLTVRDSPIASQYAASFSDGRKCLIRVLDVSHPDCLVHESRERFRHESYGQSKPSEVHDSAQGQFTRRIAKQLRLETEGTFAKFVIAIYPMAHGERLPSMSWCSAHGEVTLTFEGCTRKVLADGSIE